MAHTMPNTWLGYPAALQLENKNEENFKVWRDIWRIINQWGKWREEVAVAAIVSAFTLGFGLGFSKCKGAKYQGEENN